MDINVVYQQIKDGTLDGILFEPPLTIEVSFRHDNPDFVARPIIAAGMVKENGTTFLTVKYDGKLNGCYGTTLNRCLVKLPDGKTYDQPDEIYAVLRSYKNDYVDLDDIVF